MLLRLQPGKHGRRSHEVVVVQRVLRSRMNEVAVDREFEQQAVESQLSRLALVRGCTGTLGWRACTLFAPAHEASEDDEAAV